MCASDPPSMRCGACADRFEGLTRESASERGSDQSIVSKPSRNVSVFSFSFLDFFCIDGRTLPDCLCPCNPGTELLLDVCPQLFVQPKHKGFSQQHQL